MMQLQYEYQIREWQHLFQRYLFPNDIVLNRKMDGMVW